MFVKWYRTENTFHVMGSFDSHSIFFVVPGNSVISGSDGIIAGAPKISLAAKFVKKSSLWEAAVGKN